MTERKAGVTGFSLLSPKHTPPKAERFRRAAESSRIPRFTSWSRDSEYGTSASLEPRKPQYRMLDCFCGMGGVSDGFALEGFDVTGIDIVDAPKLLGYKHRFIQADMFSLKGEDFRGYDVIWGSPPCRDFSTHTQVNKGYPTRKPPNPKEGLTIIAAFLDFVRAAKPTLWLMENVSNLEKYLKIKPVLHFFTSKNGRRSLWGNVSFPIQHDIRPQRNMEYDYTKLSYRMRSAARAKIPLACSQAFAKACKEALEVQVKNA